MVDIDPKTGAPIIPVKEAEVKQQSFELPKPAESKQTGLENDAIRDAMDEVMSRVDTDTKTVNNVNEYIPDHTSKLKKIKLVLQNSSMDSQQLNKAMSEIARILNE